MKTSSNSKNKPDKDPAPKPPRKVVPFRDGLVGPNSTTTFLIGPRMCRWPVTLTPDADMLLCGEPTEEKQPYCPRCRGFSLTAQGSEKSD